MTLTLLFRTVPLLLLLRSRKSSASFLTLVWRESPGFLNLHQGFLFVGEWLRCSLAWNDSASEFFFQSMFRWTLVGTGPLCFAVPASKGGGRCNAEKQARLLLLLSTFNSAFTEYTLYRYREIINLFIYSLFSTKLYFRSSVFTTQRGEP